MNTPLTAPFGDTSVTKAAKRLKTTQPNTNTAPVRMHVFEFEPMFPHRHKPRFAANKEEVELAQKSVFDSACCSVCRRAEFNQELGVLLKVGANENWRVKPTGDVSDHLFCLYPVETSNNVFTVSLVLRPEMTDLQVHGYLDWMAVLAERQFGVRIDHLEADHPCRMRDTILLKRPCVYILSNTNHPDARRQVDQEPSDRLYLFNCFSADLSYYLVQNKPRVIGDIG